MRRLTKLLGLGTFIGLLTSSGRAETDLFLESRFGAEDAVIKSVDVPLEMRDIPKHKDDSYVPNANVAPIEDDAVDLYPRISLISLRAGVETGSDNLIFVGGLGLDFNFDATSYIGREHNDNLGKRKDIIERNYTDKPGSDKRGGAAALTYCYVHPSFGPDWNTFLRPNLFLEGRVRFLGYASLSCGYEMFYENLVAETGWDRNDELDIWKEYDLGSLIVGRPYVSFNIPYEDKYGGVRVGASHIIYDNLDVEVDSGVSVFGELFFRF